jgi:hypothetical protein
MCNCGRLPLLRWALAGATYMKGKSMKNVKSIPSVATGLWCAAFLIAGNASASGNYVVGLCGVFGSLNPAQDGAGSLTCPTYTDLVPLGSDSDVIAEFIDYNTDYSIGGANPVDIETDFTFAAPGVTLDWASDSLFSAGNFNSNPATDSQNQSIIPQSINYPGIPTGFWDWDCFGCVNSLGDGATVTYATTILTGGAASFTGDAYIVYILPPPSGPCPSGDICPSGLVPEPASILLFSGGMVGLLLLARKKLARR